MTFRFLTESSPLPICRASPRSFGLDIIHAHLTKGGEEVRSVRSSFDASNGSIIWPTECEFRYYR
jgi:hypothetical protein